MRILHVWNTAGVGSLMAKYLQKNGHQSEVLMRSSHDPFGITKFYGHISTDLSGPEFINHALLMARFYDVVHLHGLYRIADQIKGLFPDVKVVIQHHGTELSQCKDNEARLEAYKSCDAVIASTEDLSEILKAEGTDHFLLENAVDTEHFRPMDMAKMAEALIFDIRYLDYGSSFRFASSKWDRPLNRIDREKVNFPYEDMPKFLNTWNGLADVKCYEWTHGKPGQAYSKTGREALACGLEVLNYKGGIVKGLPTEFTPEFMVEKLIGIYEKL